MARPSNDQAISGSSYADQQSVNANVSNSTFTTNHHDDGDDEFVLEFLAFKRFSENLLRILEPCEIAMLSLGLLGNLLALITLLISKRMSTPSFLYHRALVAADLLFCCNFFVHLLLNRLTSVECNQHIFRYHFAAVYSGTVSPLVNSVCAYVLSYTTLAVAFDRLLALTSIRAYQMWNKREIALAVIAVSTILSITVHSWTTFVQHTVAEYRLDRDINDTSLIWHRCWNDQVVYQWVIRDHVTDSYRQALEVKRIYSTVFRIICPIILALMTLGIIIGVVRRGRMKWQLRKTSTTNAEGMPNFARHISPAARRRHRCEQALFLLTISVLVLAFLQVAAVEGRRILEFAFPAAHILKTKVTPTHLPLQERLANFRWILYVHQIARNVANFCTVLERSAICFLYVITNKLFRSELILMLSMIFVRGNRGDTFRRRFNSDARCLIRSSIVDHGTLITRDCDRSKPKIGGSKNGTRKRDDSSKDSDMNMLLLCSR